MLQEKKKFIVSEDLFFLRIAHNDNGVVLLVSLLGCNWTNFC